MDGVGQDCRSFVEVGIGGVASGAVGGGGDFAAGG